MLPFMSLTSEARKLISLPVGERTGVVMLGGCGLTRIQMREFSLSFML